LPLVVGAFLVIAPNAGATIRIENHNHPAGDPTVISYFLESPTWAASPFKFALHDNDFRTFGQPPGAYTARAVLPAGWKTLDIKCVGGDSSEFAIDVPNARVTMQHSSGSEQTCAFTNGKAGGPSSGVSPSPPPAELPKVKLPNEPALLGVKVGHGYALVKLRLIRRSAITLRIRRGTRTLARKQVVRKAGTRRVRIALRPDTRRWLRMHGRKRVDVTLKIRVAQRRGNVTKAFSYDALIPV
jgi:hypothetical protein